jgi:succinyl-CoA synthetase beta subunit
MNFQEFVAKPLLSAAGITVPKSRLATTPAQAAEVAASIGGVVIKAQVPIGKRGKAGGIQLADTPDQARIHANNILGMEISGLIVEKVLVEAKSDIAFEYYAAILNDPTSKSPMLMFSTEGGMDIEQIAENTPEKLRKHAIDIRLGLQLADTTKLLDGLELKGANDQVADVLMKLYNAYRDNDAELLEINPLIQTTKGYIVALDCKFVMDDSAIKRQAQLSLQGTPDNLTSIEQIGEDNTIKYIELDGNVGVLANGAGLTMTTMDVIRHHGGAPANFCEIGGEAYTKGTVALKMVLEKPSIKSLVVNFCGAFARCDVMMDGLLNAWEELKPELPVFFSIAGTGDEEAIRMLKDRLGIEPFPDMDAACKAAVKAANAWAII